MKNIKELLNKIKQKFCQILITTHSVSVVEVVDQYEITPLYKDNVKTVTELYSVLGKTDNTIYVLVEGKTDVPWIKKVIELCGLLNNYIIIPCGGASNIDPVKKELEQKGCSCKVIKDGDTNEPNSLLRDCIELYITVDEYNRLFEKSVTSVPSDKESFFDSLRNDTIGDDTVKRIISDNVNNFLTIDNPIVLEIKTLIE